MNSSKPSSAASSSERTIGGTKPCSAAWIVAARASAPSGVSGTMAAKPSVTKRATKASSTAELGWKSGKGVDAALPTSSCSAETSSRGGSAVVAATGRRVWCEELVSGWGSSATG